MIVENYCHSPCFSTLRAVKLSFERRANKLWQSGLDCALPDCAPPDCALPDSAPPDCALPDSALPDCAPPDSALP